MNFLYTPAHLPKDHELLFGINGAAQRLYDKLKNLTVDSLNISDYTKKYVNNHIRALERTLQKYSYILAWALSGTRNVFTIADYGGGSGILSLLAKEYRIPTVIYTDIYDVSCRDAKTIGEALHLTADYYVNGDIDTVISFLKTHSLSCDAVASYDVIEHIYDIEAFFTQIPHLSQQSLTVVMASGANMFHPLIRKHIMKKQREIELKDREKEWGHKERDSLRAYSTLRKEIIRNYAFLPEEKVQILARATRGMIEPAIKACVDIYVKTGYVPQVAHPTNTCDPYTGNWAEHLMDPYHLRDLLSREGFKADVLPGYYGHYEQSIKQLIGRILNGCIYYAGKQGIRLSPFFTIYGKRE